MTAIWYLVRDWEGDGIYFPKALSSLEATNANIYVCPCTGRKPGAMKDVDKWTDFIYVGNQTDIQDPKVAMLISPPENHGGRFGLVIWEGGYLSRLTQSETRSLIAMPWYMATNAPPDQIEYLKGLIKVNVPERFRHLYPNAYRAKLESEGVRP